VRTECNVRFSSKISCGEKSRALGLQNAREALDSLCSHRLEGTFV
jgi:hypothetical protein